MSKHKNRDSRSSETGRKGGSRQSSQKPHTNLSSWFTQSSIRETVESIVVAFVLAFLFRTFEAEAFVIPTGSMAPTLMGRHKDLECPKCEYQYQVNASARMDNQGVEVEPKVDSGTCPMCRFTADLSLGNPQREKYRSYSGDRILVGKFAYEFREPRRWDVVVFRYPGDPTTNYIKRMVGLPGETVYIYHGDLWIQRGDNPPEIARKEDPKKLLAMLQPVFDNDYMPKIAAWGMPERWVGVPGWTSLDGKSFLTDGSGGGDTWLRYEHRVPEEGHWGSVMRQFREQGAIKERPNVPTQLISDFYSYNTAPTPDHAGRLRPPDPPPHWVGDLAVDCLVESRSGSGQVLFDLVKGGRHFRCQIDLDSGKAALSIEGVDAEQFQPAGETAMKGPGRHHVVFANVDDQLRLIVDGREVEFTPKATYESDALGTHIPQLDDLRPVAVGSNKAALQVSHLKVLRDIYYIATQDLNFRSDFVGAGQPDLQGPMLQNGQAGESDAQAFDQWARKWFSNAPKDWWKKSHDEKMRIAKLSLAPPVPGLPDQDQFLALGDNSPQSKDSRLWDEKSVGEDRTRQHWVNREMLIGQALFIYWPHSWDRIGPVPFPFFPNFSRMHLVR